MALIAPQHDHDLRRVAIFVVMTLVLAGGAVQLAHYHGLPLRLGRASMSPEDLRGGRTIAQLENIVKKRPDFVPAHFDLAQAYFNQAEYTQAETELKRVLELQPQHPSARSVLGMVYLNENRPQDAKNTFTQVLAQEPNNAEAHNGLGMTLAAEDNHQVAIEQYKAAARLDPQSSGVYYNLGLSYAKLKQYDNAVDAYLKEQQQGGDYYELETALADAYQAIGSTQKAQAAAKKAAHLKKAR
jgi:tetratricopeptide (TPR) repeat protein